MTQQTRDLNRETETMKKKQMEILELKSKIIHMKNLLVMFNSRFGRKVERNSELKARSIEIISV